MKWYLFTIVFFEIILGLVLASNSYGTGDVRVVENWVNDFFNLGFWEGFKKNSTYPHVLNQVFYLTGIYSFFVSGSQIGPYFVVAHKLLAYLMVIISSVILFNRANTVNGRVLALSIPLNPAVLLHTTILGFMDAFYILFLILTIVMFSKLMDGKTSLFNLILAILALTFGPLLNWQFLYFTPVFMLILLYLFFVKRKYVMLKVLFFSFLIFILSLLIPVSGMNLFERVFALVISFARITTENFVVANISNFWQIVNFFVHKCSLSYCEGLPRNMLLYWQNLELMRLLRIPYLVLLLTYSLILLTKMNILSIPFVHKMRSIRLRDPELFLIAVCLWFNLIYVLFNTGVHENHFIPSVLLSAWLVIRKGTRISLILFMFFTFYNFINLLIFYQFGMRGLFGIVPGMNPLVVNIGSMVLSVLLLCTFVYLFIRLLKSNDESLGLA